MATAEPGAVTVRCRICANGAAPEFKIEGPLRHGMPESYWQHLNTAHPLDCEWVRGLLPTYVHGRPSPETGERMVLHLADCEGCRKELRHYINASVRD